MSPAIRVSLASVRLDRSHVSNPRLKLILSAIVLGASAWPATRAWAAPVLPDFSASTFAAGAPIDNPYHPLVPGTVRTYEADVTDPDTGEVTHESVKVTVTSQTLTIAGVSARVVRDRSLEDGQLAEDTFDYFAQDKQGNVWYLGEDTTSFEYDDDGNVVSTSHAGSWRAGVEGAKPGFIMPANRVAGFNYYQEFAPANDALDQAEIVSLNESVTVPLGSFTDVVKTRETSEVEPGVVEFKFYAPGIGEILTLEDLNAAGEAQTRVELVSVTAAAEVPLPTGAWIGLVATALLLLSLGFDRLVAAGVAGVRR